jgi:hydroxymethylpyrimidine/phosphomethylpyrimidine kinase
MGCPSRARVLASGTFASPIRVNAQYTRLARTSRSIGCDTVKTGMLANAEIIDAVAAAISDHRLGPLVVDPVMIAKSGARLLKPDAIEALKIKLLPLATVVKPNLHEAGALTGREITTLEQMKEAAG